MYSISFKFRSYFLAGSSEAVYNGGDSGVIPYVQTLRKFPKEELRAKVALVRFDSTIMLCGGEDQNVQPQPTSSALLTVKYLLEAGAKVILVSEWCVNLELESVAGIVSKCSPHHRSLLANVHLKFT